MSGTKTPVYICPLGHLSPVNGPPGRTGGRPPRCPECHAAVSKFYIDDPFATVHDPGAPAGRSGPAPEAAPPPPAAPDATQLAAADPALPPLPAPIAPPAPPAPVASSVTVASASPGATPTQRSSRPPIPGAPEVPGYTLLGEVGRGATGVVYKARHEKLKRVVALKMISVDPAADPYFAEWFQAEAESAARLHHPNIVQIFEIGGLDGRPFLALEFVSGGTLKKQLDGRPRPPRASAELVETLAKAVQVAHARGLVHRDLKPANVLLEPPQADEDHAGLPEDKLDAEQVFGAPKVADFGLSKRLDDDFDPVRYGDVVGTPLYMAPEQARGETEGVGPASDVYALGAILYELITGRPPFVATSVPALLKMVTMDRPVPPRRLCRRVSRDLEAVCLRCLEKEPRKRYPTANALAEDLRRFLDGRPVKARRVGSRARVWNWSLHNPVPASLLLAVSVVLGVGQWKLRQLSTQIVTESAEASAAQQTATIGEVYALYSEVARQVKDAKGDASTIELTHKYPAEHAVPIPARFTILLGERMEALVENNPDGRQGHMFSRLHVYSNHPFRDRPGNPPKPRSFASDALKHYEADPSARDQPYNRIETDADDRTVLRHATTLTMKEACLGCHNNKDNYEPKFRDRARTDWKEGDVRGILVVDIPLTREFKQTDREIFGTYLLLAGLGAATMAASLITLTLARR